MARSGPTPNLGPEFVNRKIALLPLLITGDLKGGRPSLLRNENKNEPEAFPAKPSATAHLAVVNPPNTREVLFLRTLTTVNVGDFESHLV